MKLLKYIVNAWNKVSHTGCSAIPDASLKSRITLSNKIALLVWVSASLVSSSLFSIDRRLGLYFALVPLVYLLVPLMNYLGRHTLSRFLLTFLPLFVFTIASGLFCKDDTVLKFAFITVILCPIFLFGIDEPVKMVVGISGISLQFWISGFLAALFPKLAMHDISGNAHAELISLLITFSIILFVMAFYVFQKQNASNQMQIQQAAEKIRQQNEIREKFFQIMTHDLKDPIIGIKITSESFIGRPHSTASPEECARMGRLINRAACNAVEMLEKINSWGLVHSGKIRIKPERVNANDLIKDLLQGMPIIEEKNITVHCRTRGKGIFTVDRNILETILRNLLSNAAKFSPYNGKITILMAGNESSCFFLVGDNGIGIPAKKIESIFSYDRQYRQTGTAGETGTGLGLLICRELAENHAGTIKVKSRAEMGSAFVFTLKADVHPRSSCS